MVQCSSKAKEARSFFTAQKRPESTSLETVGPPNKKGCNRGKGGLPFIYAMGPLSLLGNFPKLRPKIRVWQPGNLKVTL